MATQPFESVRQALSRVDPNTAQDILRSLAFGDVLRAAPVYLRSVSAGTTGAVPQQLATLGCVVLPEDAKAAYILRCTVKAAGVALGEFTVEPYGTTPATTQVAVAPNGDIVFLGSDAVTSADILYVPEKGDVLGQLANSNATQNTSLGASGFGTGITSLTLAVTPGTGVCALPSAYAGKTILLMQANATAGTTTGQKIILVPAGSAPATGKAALNTAKTQILFATADAVTSCTVDILVASGLAGGADVNAILEAANSQYA
jgi:hypothetical protein